MTTTREHRADTRPAAASGTDSPDTPGSPRSARLRSIAAWTASAALIALVAAALLFHATGGRWFIVQTPSMGTFAPVGTLVLTTPTPIEDIRVGDVISFHPSTTPDETYTHRVVSIAEDGTLGTQGDINGAVDPWQTTGELLIGEVTTALPGLGWLAKGLPMLLAGGVIVWLLTRLIGSPTYRVSMRMLGLSLVASFTVFVLRPLVGVVVLEANITGERTDATLVSTGMLPIRVQAVEGSHADLVSGQVGSITVPANGDDFYTLSSALHLPLWGWVVFILLCALPLLYTMIVGLPTTPDRLAEHGRRARTETDPDHPDTTASAETATLDTGTTETATQR